LGAAPSAGLGGIAIFRVDGSSALSGGFSAAGSGTGFLIAGGAGLSSALGPFADSTDAAPGWPGVGTVIGCLQPEQVALRPASSSLTL
jgi:hypothetical protein